jgi:hypothetical protein
LVAVASEWRLEGEGFGGKGEVHAGEKSAQPDGLIGAVARSPVGYCDMDTKQCRSGVPLSLPTSHRRTNSCYAATLQKSFLYPFNSHVSAQKWKLESRFFKIKGNKCPTLN